MLHLKMEGLNSIYLMRFVRIKQVYRCKVLSTLQNWQRVSAV